jgi:hypothetical protein
VVTNATGQVTVALGDNPGGGGLAGTTSSQAVNGIATFADLAIDRPAAGYTLLASAGALPVEPSAPFSILLPGQDGGLGEDAGTTDGGTEGDGGLALDAGRDADGGPFLPEQLDAGGEPLELEVRCGCRAGSVVLTPLWLWALAGLAAAQRRRRAPTSLDPAQRA